MSKRLQEASTYIAAAESGEGDQFLYKQAAVLIEEEMKANPSLTQRDVAAELDPPRSHSYVSRLLRELVRSRAPGKTFKINWQSGSNKRPLMPSADLVIEAAMEHIEKAPPKKQKKLIEKMTSQSTVAGRHISNEVVAREKAKADKEKERPESVTTGIPASGDVGLDQRRDGQVGA